LQAGSLKTACAGLVALGLAALVVGLTSAPSAAATGTAAAPSWDKGAPQREQCRRAILSRRPAWTASAAFTANDELVVIDQMYNKVLRYSASGESLGTLPDAVESSVERFFPITVKTRGTDVMFLLSGDRVSTHDLAYMPLSQVAFSQGRTANSGDSASSIAGFFLWQPVGHDDVFSFSDIKTVTATGKVDWTCGFVRFPLTDPSHLAVLDQLPWASSLRLFNRLGFQYLAALGDTAFTLRMDDLRIYRQVGNSPLEPLSVALPAVTRPPSLPPFETQDDFSTVMAAVETSTMPIGIYAWNDALFVVTRVFDGSSTTWTITKIDPTSGNILGTATIPTVANHLTIAPGPTHWAFIEKGPVTSWNEEQVIPTVLFVSADKFAGHLSGDICGGQFGAD
jgi:hypothetical protein